MENLQTELLVRIFEYVDFTSHPSSQNILLVNHRWSQIFRDLVYGHHMTIDLLPDADHNLEQDGTAVIRSRLQANAEDPAIQRNLRNLTITRSRNGNLYPFPSRFSSTQGIVRTLIANAKQLVLLKWQAHGVPNHDMIRKLQTHHPRAKLYIADCHGPRDTQPSDQLVHDLARSPLLTSIGCNIRWFEPTSDRCEAVFRYIVSRAPNLLEVRAMNMCADQIEEGQTAQWQNTFPMPAQPNRSVRHFTLDTFELSREVLQDWAGIIDVSELIGFHMLRGQLRPDFFDIAVATLPRLRRLSLNLYVDRTMRRNDLSEGLAGFLHACGPLEALSLWSWSGAVSLDLILERHGSSLEFLGLHDRDFWLDWAPVPERKYLSSEELRDLLLRCPKLKALTFDLKGPDLDTDIESPIEIEEYLSLLRSSNIENLEVYLDGQLALQNVYALQRWSQPKRPTIDDVFRAYSQTLWRRIYADKRSGDRKLVVKVGEWERYRNREQHGLILGFEHSAWKFELVPEDRDDRLDKCKIEWQKLVSR